MNTSSLAAQQIIQDAIVCDMTVPISVPSLPELRDALPKKMLDAGFTFASFTVAEDNKDFAEAMKAIAFYRAMFIGQDEHCILVNTIDDIYRAKAQGKLAVSLHFQGTVPVGRDLSLVEPFYKLGIRHMLLAYNQRNFVADGCHELGEGGLSRFGKELIAEMNRVGMFVDVAHTNYTSSMQAIEVSQAPVICSHGNIWALHQHARCYKDDQIKAIASTGGVFGLTGMSIFTGDAEASAEGFARQLDYVAQLVGVEHVGLGLDYVADMPTLAAAAQAFASRWPADGGYTRTDIKQLELDQLGAVVDHLLARGYSAHDIGAMLGGNWLRVMKQIWKDPA